MSVEVEVDNTYLYMPILVVRADTDVLFPTAESKSVIWLDVIFVCPSMVRLSPNDNPITDTNNIRNKQSFFIILSFLI